jgi:hypothetical protein
MVVGPPTTSTLTGTAHAWRGWLREGVNSRPQYGHVLLLRSLARTRESNPTFLVRRLMTGECRMGMDRRAQRKPGRFLRRPARRHLLSLGGRKL